MSNASIKKAERRSSPELELSSGRFKRTTRRLKKPQGNGYTLAMIREGAGKTQTEVAKATGMQQSEVSRLERRSDVLVSTLRKYAEALGAECEVVIVFPTGHRMVVVDPPRSRG